VGGEHNARFARAIIEAVPRSGFRNARLNAASFSIN
jgi:hypothetical protein